ncbi:MAG: hypothetical protein UR43_C0005G0125 [candidate division TM6 bacterium GW2011_GWF2_33_332]|nr:MAG: hypothetical protein UR43_C0005G0125 [candidate division TM6 bacterium GW2011_GWF2_33_332]
MILLICLLIIFYVILFIGIISYKGKNYIKKTIK